MNLGQENWLRQKEELKAWAAAQGGSTDLHKVMMILMRITIVLLMMIGVKLMMIILELKHKKNDNYSDDHLLWKFSSCNV